MKLTKRTVEAIHPTGHRFSIWDDEINGFGIRVEASGRKTFICRYRSGAARRQYSIGKFGVVTVEEARAEAKRILGRASLGEDPSSDKQSSRHVFRFRDLVEAFIEGHCPKLKPSTAKDYASALLSHAVPAFGPMAVKDISGADLNRLHLKLADRPYRANRVIAIIGSAISWGQKNGLVAKGFNPVVDIKRFREPSRERYLRTEELERLGQVLAMAETEGLPWEIRATGEAAKHVPKNKQRVIYPPEVTAAIRLYLLTGCRLMEILNARWQDVDRDRGILWLPDSKTGRRPVVLSSMAIGILNELERKGTYIIPGSDPDQPRHDLKRPWKHIRQTAGLEDVRLHDLRHTYASIGAGAGLGLPIVGKLLGHKSQQTTQRYAHLADDPVRRGAELVGEAIGKTLKQG